MTVLQIGNALVCIAASVVANSSAPIQEAELTWKKHYDSAKSIAQAAARPLVVVLENPKMNTEKIDETKLTTKDRETIAREKFELVRVDVNTDYGKKVAAAFGATRFPYTAVTDDRSVRIVYRKAGQMSEQDWTVALARSKQVPQPTQVVQPQPVVTDFGTPVYGGQVYGGQYFPQVIGSPASCVGNT